MASQRRDPAPSSVLVPALAHVLVLVPYLGTQPCLLKVHQSLLKVRLPSLEGMEKRGQKGQVSNQIKVTRYRNENMGANIDMNVIHYTKT